jgi:hypothetical protein
MKSKYFSIVLISAAFCSLTLSASRAGTDSVGSTAQKAKKPQSEIHRSTGAKSIRRSSVAQDWRISYYAHISATPWWPNAPGD